MHQLTYQAFLFESWVLVPLASVVLVSGMKITHYNNKKIMNLFNSKITLFQRNLNIHIHKTIKTFIEEHNEFCGIIADLNGLGGPLMFIFMFTLIPINLIWLHQLLFEDMAFHNRVFIGFTSMVWVSQIFTTLFGGAFFSKQMHLTTKKLAQLQWKLNGWPFRLRNKIKLMTYFERLSSKKKIGITIGPLTAITYPVFYVVLIFDFCLIFY